LTFFLDEDHENKELSIPEEVSEETATTVLHLVQYFAQQRVVINKVLFCLALQDRCASCGLSTITIPSERKHAHIFYNIFNIKSNIQKQSRRVYTITYTELPSLTVYPWVSRFSRRPPGLTVGLENLTDSHKNTIRENIVCSFERKSVRVCKVAHKKAKKSAVCCWNKGSRAIFA
jgi:hypothetical protein